MRELPEETLYDTRLIERHIKEGLISEEDVNKRLEDLEDCESNMDVVDLEVLSAAPVPAVAPVPVAQAAVVGLPTV